METLIAASVRRAQPSDTAALTELVNRAYAIEEFFVEGDRTTADEIAALIQPGGFLVLEHAGGLAAAVPLTHRSVKRPCHFIEMAKPLVPEGLLYMGSEIGTS